MKVEYYNFYTHFIFTTIHREPLITEEHRERIEKYITGIVSNHNCKMYAIYANPEHVHFLVSRSPDIDEQALATIISNSSQKFINDSNLLKVNFQWQISCSAFSVSKADIDKVCKYILNQADYHRKHTYSEEYEKFISYYQKTLNQQ
jgi:putative transposase